MKGESSTPGVKVGVASTEYSLAALCAAAGEGESVLEGVSPLSVVVMIRVPLRFICFGGPCSIGDSHVKEHGRLSQT